MSKEYLQGRQRANGGNSFWGDRDVPARGGNSRKDARGAFLRAQNELGQLSEKRDKIISSAADIVSRYAMQLGNGDDDITSPSSIENELRSLVKSFSDSEAKEILLAAMSKIIVNM